MKMIYKIILLFVIVVLIYFIYQYPKSSKYIISSEKAKKLIMSKKINLILDVRTNMERDMLGYYPGSVHIQSEDLEKRMMNEYPNKNIKILIYCNTGHRAKIAAEKLHDMGYKNTFYILSTYKTLM
jgi:rhodanese-related sulfurtransferase